MWGHTKSYARTRSRGKAVPLLFHHSSTGFDISNIFEVIPTGASDCVFPSRIVTVQFWTEQEECIDFQSYTLQGNPEIVARSIPVLYDPNHPSDAKIHSFEGLWLTSRLVMVSGAGLSLLFTSLFVSVLK
jgi:hypothetical protein